MRTVPVAAAVAVVITLLGLSLGAVAARAQNSEPPASLEPLFAPGPTIASTGRAAPTCTLGPPVDAAVVDPFRRPSHRFGPGNRGIEYDTSGGEEVVAAATGTVDFAGPVGGRRYVVLRHPGDRRTTYGPLSGAGVVRGQNVTAGAKIGEADAGFHFTLRIGDTYHDPAPGLAGRCGRVRLLPPGTLSGP
ncbi:MAG: M23 family metallopeptidase [Actinomycetota bacterium]